MPQKAKPPMGEAKRRGTFEQRVAQAAERKKERERIEAEELARLRSERRRQASERQKLLGKHERKEAVLTTGSGPSKEDLMDALGALAKSGVVIAYRGKP